jgi:hypothetical protein
MLMAFAGLLCLAGSACLIRAGMPGGPLHVPLVRRRGLGDLYTLLFVAVSVLGGALLVNAVVG